MSVTTWTRLEPDTQTGDPQQDLAFGIAARLGDPLWLLGRQWQMGELQGEDAGSPIVAQLSASSFAIDHVDAASVGTPYSLASTAVDAYIESDGGGPDLRARASGGAAFLDQLAETKLLQYQVNARALYGFDPAGKTTPLDAAMIAAAGADGGRIFADAVSGKLAAQLGVVSGDAAAFATLVQNWRAWYAERAAAAVNPAWVEDRLEYRFSIGATVPEGRVTLTAPEHTGGRMDWHSFTAAPFAASSGAQAKTASLKALPLVLQIPGMPSPWFWQIENPDFDLGRIQAGPSDTARMLLIEAALAYSTDWFLMPLRLPFASLSRIDSLQVSDTFGVTTVIRPSEQVHPHDGWALWRLSQGGQTLPYLLLPPPNACFLSSEPVEEVAFVRDEAADMGWALHRIPPAAAASVATPAGPGGDYVYVPMTALPDNRRPLVMTESAAGRFLVAGQMLNQAAPGPTPLMGAQFQMRDETLPDEGLLLRRQYQLGRTPDGVLHLWTSRASVAGARAPSSGLTFDRLDHSG